MVKNGRLDDVRDGARLCVVRWALCDTGATAFVNELNLYERRLEYRTVSYCTVPSRNSDEATVKKATKKRKLSVPHNMGTRFVVLEGRRRRARVR